MGRIRRRRKRATVRAGLLAPVVGAGTIFISANPVGAYVLIGTGCQFPADATGVSVSIFSNDSSVVTAAQVAQGLWAPGTEAPPIVGGSGSRTIVVTQYSDSGSGYSAFTSTENASPSSGSFPMPQCGFGSWLETPVVWANVFYFDQSEADENAGRIGHEFGHAYGLHHPGSGAVTKCVSPPNSLMWDGPEVYNYCQTIDLQSDDIAGLNSLYK